MHEKITKLKAKQLFDLNDFARVEVRTYAGLIYSCFAV